MAVLAGWRADMDAFRLSKTLENLTAQEPVGIRVV